MTNETNTKACQEIERLQLENTKLKEQCLELSDEMLWLAPVPLFRRVEQAMK